MSRTRKDSPKEKAIRCERQRQSDRAARSSRKSASSTRALGRLAVEQALAEAAADRALEALTEQQKDRPDDR